MKISRDSGRYFNLGEGRGTKSEIGALLVNKFSKKRLTFLTTHSEAVIKRCPGN